MLFHKKRREGVSRNAMVGVFKSFAFQSGSFQCLKPVQRNVKEYAKLSLVVLQNVIVILMMKLKTTFDDKTFYIKL